MPHPLSKACSWPSHPFSSPNLNRQLTRCPRQTYSKFPPLRGADRCQGAAAQALQTTSISSVQACPLRGPHSASFITPHPWFVKGGATSMNEADMTLAGHHDPLNPSRHSNLTSRFAVPRYRLTLVREGRAIPTTEFVETSEGAALRCLPA